MMELTEKDIADYTLKACLARVDFAFDSIRQYRAAWNFPAVFISDKFQRTIETAAEYVPLNSCWSIKAHTMLRQNRLKNALVVLQRGSTSKFWSNVPHFLACHLATSLMEKGQYAFGTGTRGGDIIDLSFHSPLSTKEPNKWRYHFCEQDGFTGEFLGSRLAKYRGTMPCRNFDEFQSDVCVHEKSPCNKISQCKTCGMSFLYTLDFEPSALERMYHYMFRG